MSCNENLNSSWGDILDSNIIYTGLTTMCELLEISPGMKQREVISVLAMAICAIRQGDDPIPQQIFEDPDLTIDTTAEYLNVTYPELLNGGIIYNSVNSIQFTKYPTGYKFEIIDIRS